MSFTDRVGLDRPKMFAIWLCLSFLPAALLAIVFQDAFGDPRAARAIAIAYPLPIAIATAFVQGPLLKQPLLAPLGLRFRLNAWWMNAWLAPLLMLFVGLWACHWLTDVALVLDADSFLAMRRESVAQLGPEALARFEEVAAENRPLEPLWFWLIAQGLPAGVTINLVIALASEVGFRGFLFREVQGGFWARSLQIGAIEGLFFAPAIACGLYFPGDPVRGVGIMLLTCLALSPVLVYLRVRSGSTLACAAFRGTILALGGAAADLSGNAPEWARPFFGVGGIAGALVILGLFLLHDRFMAVQPLIFTDETPEEPPA